MTTSEVFPNAPLALVAMEVRFPEATAGPLRPPVLRAIKEYLGEGWVIEGGHEQMVEIVMVPGSSNPPTVTSEKVSRLTVRDRTKAITVRSGSLTVEATTYYGYAEFRTLLATAFQAVEKVLAPDGHARMGLRYIDEIRVPADPVDWADWVHESLLAPRGPGLMPAGWTSAVRYEFESDRSLVLRYGPTAGSVINPAGPLKRPKAVPGGPAFVLDFDSFWEPGGIPAFVAADLLTACDELRAPVRTLFDQMITPALASVFRGEATA